MLLKNIIYQKLKHFDQDSRGYVQGIVGAKNMCELTSRQEYIFLKMWRSVDENITDFQKQMLINILEKIYVEHEVPILHLANRGENLRIDVKLDTDEDDFTGSILLARNAADFAALSDETLAGSAQEIQSLTLVDVSLDAESFYKVLILTEVPDSGGSASGDVHAVVNEVYLYVDTEVDSDNP